MHSCLPFETVTSPYRQWRHLTLAQSRSGHPGRLQADHYAVGGSWRVAVTLFASTPFMAEGRTAERVTGPTEMPVSGKVIPRRAGEIISGSRVTGSRVTCPESGIQRYRNCLRTGYRHIVTDPSIQRSGSASSLYLLSGPMGRLSKSQCNPSGIGRRGLECHSNTPSFRYAEASLSEASSSGSTITRSPGAGPLTSWHQISTHGTQGPASTFPPNLARVLPDSAKAGCFGQRFYPLPLPQEHLDS